MTSQPPAPDEKAALRAKMLERRSEMAPARRRAAEAQATDALIRMLESPVTKARKAGRRPIIGAYLALGSELSVDGLLRRLSDADVALAYPLCLPGRAMEFYVGRDASAQLPDMLKGRQAHVFSPDEAEAMGACVQPSELAALVVPMLAFDSERYRLGMGGGYYDRYLPRLPGSVQAIGLAFDEQCVAKLPRGPFDAALSMVVTPTRVV